MGKCAVLAIVVALAILAEPSAQVDAPRGTQVIRGRVVAGDDSGRVLRGARVSVTGTAVTIAPVFTDAEGRFAVGVPASYTLTVTKGGFAPAILRGAAAAGVGEVEIGLTPGAVLTGLVADERGFPVHDARVRARWLDPVAGAPAALVDFTGDTDDTGRYRIGSLPPGRYTLHSERQLPRITDMDHPGDPVADIRRQLIIRELSTRLAAMSDVTTVTIRRGEEAFVPLVHKAPAVTPPDAPISGGASGVVLDEFGDVIEGVVLRLRRLRYSTDRLEAERATLVRLTDDRGEFRFFHVPPGRYLLEAGLDDAGYAAVYYPGVPTIAAAAPIVIARNQEVPGLNVTFTRIRGARVFGFALNAAGGPFSGSVSLTASRRAAVPSLPPRVVSSDAAGVFEFLNVPPGEYVLRLLTARSAARQPEEFGVQVVRVEGPEVAPVTIAASPGATIAGRVVFEGDASGLSPRDFGLITVPDPDYGPIGTSVAVPGDDGTFELRAAGTMRVSAGQTPPGWWMKSFDVDGINAVEVPVRFSGPLDARRDVTAVFSNAGATLVGRVRDGRGEPVDDYRIVAFSVDRTRWFGRSPYVRITGGPDGDGGFTLRTLPPGDYFVVAVDAIDGDGASGDWQNPDVLASLVAAATRLSVAEGQRVPTELRLTRWGR